MHFSAVTYYFMTASCDFLQYFKEDIEFHLHTEQYAETMVLQSSICYQIRYARKQSSELNCWVMVFKKILFL
jgi:hypothetical protein